MGLWLLPIHIPARYVPLASHPAGLYFVGPESFLAVD